MGDENIKTSQFSVLKASAGEKLEPDARKQRRVELLKNVGAITVVAILSAASLFGIGLAVGVFGGEPTKTS